MKDYLFGVALALACGVARIAYPKFIANYLQIFVPYDMTVAIVKQLY
jgi:hypothetical protein